MDELDSAIEQTLASNDKARMGAVADPLDDAVSSVISIGKAKQQASLRTAVQVNPDEAAKANKLAASRGLPPDLVLRNLPQVTQQQQLEDANKALETAPALADQVRDPAFAQVSHDNLTGLAIIENSIARGWQGLKQMLPGMGFRASAGALDSFQSVEAKMTRGEQVLDTEDPMGVRFMTPDQRKGLREQLLGAAGRHATTIAAAEAKKAEYPSPGVVADVAAAKTFKGAFDAFLTDPVRYIASIGPESLVQNVPAIGAAAATGGVAGLPAAAATMGAGSFMVDYNSSLLEGLRKAGVDVKDAKQLADAAKDSELMRKVASQAFAHAAVVSAFDGASGGVAGKLALPARTLAGKPIAREVANIAAQVPVQGALGGAGELGGQIASGQEISPGDILAEIVGEGFGAPAEVAGAAGKQIVSRVQEAKAKAETQKAATQASADYLTNLLKLAEKDKLRERDPTSFAGSVQKMAEHHGAPTEVYIDASKLAETLAQSGMSPEQIENALPSAKGQLAEAVTAGGDVVVPVGEFTALVAGSGFEQQLVKHARLAPDALSQEDLKVLAQVNLKTETDQVMAQQAQVSESQAVRSQVFEQLSLAGRFSPSVNEAYADSVAALYETQAARLGIPVAEFAKRYPLNVTGVLGTDAKLDQGERVYAGNFKDKQGRDFGVEITREMLGLNKDTPSVNVSATFEGGRRGRIDFGVLPDGTLAAENTMVAGIFRGAGIAEGMYRAAREAGFDIAPGRKQTEQGDKMVESLLAKGVINKPRAESLNQDADPKGTFTPSTNTIALLAKADLSTFHHELGHFYLEVLADMAAQPDAPASVVEDMNKVLEWFGVPDLATWQGMTLDQQRDSHEKFARGYEAWLFEGKAPSTALARTFQRFSEWMRRIYKSIRALNVELNDDIRRVYDRMLASEEAIKEAETARAYAPLFKDEKTLEEAGVDPASYHELGREATAEAIDRLQARSIRDMRWLSNAKSRALKALQKEAATIRKGVEAQVRDEVGRMPVYAAENFLRRGVLPEGDRNNAQRRALDATQGMNTKLDLAALKDMYGDSPAAPWRYLATGKTGLATTKDGLHPDIVADIFGFPSGDALVRELLAAEPQAQVVEGLTDQRMLEEHGELSSPEAIERAAEQAIHNEARGKFIATELAALDKALGPARVLVAAAKQFATAVLGKKKITDIKPHVFTAAETRAAKLAEKSIGKVEEAATAKRNQLLNHYAARYAHDAVGEIARIREFFDRVANTPDDRLKSRDMDVVNAARAVLAVYGVGRKGEAAAEYLKKVAAYDPEMSQVLQASVDAAMQGAKPLTELTLDELRALNDEVASLWYLAKRSRQMEVDGDMLDREDVQDQLKARIEDIGIPDRIAGEGSAVTPAEARLAKLRSFVASARRTESWVGAKDGGNSGPFRRFIWQPVKEAADAYRTDKAKALKQFRELLKPIADTLKKRLIDAPELGYTFGKDEGGVGLSEVLHAILHTGNESNKRKLLLGRKWATELPDGTLDNSRWDAFVQRMVDEGVLKKEHFDFVQGVWDLLETTKPLAQKTHRDVFGKYFAEITAEPVQTPFGEYRGGYVPALADPRAVSDAAIRQLMEQENSSMQFAFPATNKGFTKSRVEYNRPLLLDLKSIPQHLDKVLLFSHMERPVRDVRRVLTSNAVAYGLNRIDPKAFSSMLTPWLNRAARQQVETPAPDHWKGWRFWSVVRGRAGMAAMFGNIVNAAQQVTGFSLAAVKVRPKHLLGATATYLAAPRQTARAVAEASEYMAGRMENEIAHMNDAIRDVLIDPTAYQSTKAFFSKHAYFLQSAVDNTMGPIIWTGAYNQALEQGQTEDEARRFADSTVRETQGSTLPEDISNFETGPAFVRMFTQFAGYFNMQANLLGTSFANIPKEMGLAQKAAKGFYIFMLGFLVPAMVSEAMVQAFRGGPDDDDKDGEYLDDWLAALGMGTLRNATAMVPIVGQGANALVNALNKKPYDDRMGTSPAISMLESAVRGAIGVPKKLLDDKELRGRDVRDVATLISMALGIPVNVLAKPIGYATEVESGRVAPTSPADAARGYVSGAASPDSKR